MTRVLCWFGTHDWLVTVCGFSPDDHGGWVREKPERWSPVAEPYGRRRA